MYNVILKSKGRLFFFLLRNQVVLYMVVNSQTYGFESNQGIYFQKFK